MDQYSPRTRMRSGKLTDALAILLHDLPKLGCSTKQPYPAVTGVSLDKCKTMLDECFHTVAHRRLRASAAFLVELANRPRLTIVPEQPYEQRTALPSVDAGQVRPLPAPVVLQRFPKWRCAHGVQPSSSAPPLRMVNTLKTRDTSLDQHETVKEW